MEQVKIFEDSYSKTVEDKANTWFKQNEGKIITTDKQFFVCDGSIYLLIFYKSIE
ncbi:MAG TPA: hypothetical protein PLX95_03390 [bacterium]|nr:hypothetical protein [Patescibacteria group bacterium]HPD74299.1 hypothetical protein [bacterium]